MKKYLIALAALFCLKAYSQTASSILLTFKQLKVDTFIPSYAPYALAPNGVIEAPTWDSLNTQVTIDIKNTSSTTHTYEVIRYDVTLNNSATYSTTASAYFCFAGLCFGANTTTSPSKLTLRSGKSASDTSAAFFMLVSDLDEASVVGYSHIKYTFRDNNNHNDSVQISLKYNDPAKVGITKINKVLASSMDVYPNPAHDNAILKVNSLKSFESRLMLYNALGSVVYSENISISEGQNQIPLSVQNLSPGVYIANIKQGEHTITKKFIVD